MQPKQEVRTRAATADDAFGEPRPRIDPGHVLKAYHRWAPVYDFVFGRSMFGRNFDRARDIAMDHLNTRRGDVLEVGVGTGLTLPRYRPDTRIYGIDISPDMLAIAEKRKVEAGLDNVAELREMDAARLDYPDARFDTVAVMFTITVVPHPDEVMAEVERVTKPGGEAIFVSHFASENGLRKAFEALITPITSRIGWRPDFPVSRILSRPGFEHLETRPLDKIGVFSMVRLRRKG
jgi:phosphatidylethanolamine/phosphatidyl-N-methylethanolamine N-methyltransferase